LNEAARLHLFPGLFRHPGAWAVCGPRLATTAFWR